MNGVRIGMVLFRVPLRRILLVPIVGRIVCSVVVAGTAMRGAAVRRSVATSLRISVTTISGFAWLSPSNDIFTKEKGSRFFVFFQSLVWRIRIISLSLSQNRKI